ncbi:Alpha/Beta hydrolase protein [Hyaloraphidium curvatum]|nr:Alpha/Beta hydrolase protein [Hyaloraphidium curvatum]
MDNDDQKNQTALDECLARWGNNITFAEISPAYPARKDRNFAGYVAFVNTSNTGSALEKPIIVVGLRGTSNADEAIADLQASQENCSAVGITEVACGVHTGFGIGFDDLRPAISGLLASYLARHPNSPVLVTGHSLGGALASLFAQDIARNYTKGANATVKDLQLFTYGEPRTFTPNFSPTFRQDLVPNSHRVVNYLDPIPHLPPNDTDLGLYAHVGTPYFIFGNSTTSCSLNYSAVATCELQAPTGEDRNCQNILWTFKAGVRGDELKNTAEASARTLAWHLLDNYFLGYRATTPFPGGTSSPVSTVTAATATGTATASTSRPSSGRRSSLVELAQIAFTAGVSFLLFFVT